MIDALKSSVFQSILKKIQRKEHAVLGIKKIQATNIVAAWTIKPDMYS